jgi:tRNA nucleotidyltransferase/poly(A) polymerase
LQKKYNRNSLQTLCNIEKIENNVKNQSIEQVLESQFRFDFDTETRRSMKKNYYLVKFLPKERVKEEILRVFKETDNPFGFVSLMDELNILKYIFFYVSQTKCVDQPVRYHPLDTYHHIMMSLYFLQFINKNYLVRLAMLYHDVAKPDQYRYTKI